MAVGPVRFGRLTMDPCEFYRQVANRTARTPAKVAQAPLRAAQLATVEPGVTPFDVVYEEGPVALRRYEPRVADGERRDVPVVIAYPFINDPSILDFAADRSVVRSLLERGFPVYLVEWSDPTPLDRSLGLGDYVVRFLYDCVEVVREETGADDVHLHGYSTCAPLVAGYAGCFPEDVRTLLLQGPPLSFDSDDGTGEPDEDSTGMDLFRRLAEHHDPEQVAEAFDTVPTPLLELVLALRKPVEYAVTNPLRLWDRFDDERYVEEYGRKLAWARGGPHIPAAVYREFVEDLLFENRLLEGTWNLYGRNVDLEAIDVPVLLLLGSEDRFVPRSASVPFLEAIPSEDATVLEVPTGHVGTSIAPEAHEVGWPQVGAWLSRRSGASSLEGR